MKPYKTLTFFALAGLLLTACGAGGAPTPADTPMPAVYGASGIFAWLAFTLILAAIASALPARRASRLTVRDTLAYE